MDSAGASTIYAEWNEFSMNALTISVPDDWNVEREVDSITLEHEGKTLAVVDYPGFAVCGTGLEERIVLIAGMEAHAGFYDGSKLWSFIVLTDDFVVLNHAGDDWNEEERAAIAVILNTIFIEKEDAQ